MNQTNLEETEKNMIIKFLYAAVIFSRDIAIFSE